MKKMSKLQAAMIAVGTAALLAACSSGGAKTQDTTAQPAQTTEKAETTAAGTEKTDAGTEKAEGEPVELRISWWGSDARHEATLKVLDLFMEKHPNIKVTAEYQGFDGYHDKLMTQISSGTEPDVFQLDNNVYFCQPCGK